MKIYTVIETNVERGSIEPIVRGVRSFTELEKAVACLRNTVDELYEEWGCDDDDDCVFWNKQRTLWAFDGDEVRTEIEVIETELQ